MKAFCWDCKKFNERTYDALTNIVDIKETDIQVQITPNNWTKSENCFASEYKDKFQASCNPILIDRRELFDQIFKCEGYGEELLMDHEGINYDSNFVTMYDLMLNHLKKGICGPAPRHYTRGKYSISIDTTAIYPSLTNWGLRNKMYREKEKMTRQKAVSEYKSKYVSK